MLQKAIGQDLLSMGERLCLIHEEISKKYAHLCRIAVTVMDHETKTLKTFAHYSDGNSPISFYDFPIDQATSLMDVAEKGTMRIIDDLSVIGSSSSHTKRLLDAGYISSMTIPIVFKGKLFGFLFFNSKIKSYFNDARLATLKSYAGVISLLVVNELHLLSTFKGAVKTAREFSRHRDEETGNHLERMSRYARLIALDMAPNLDKPDDWVEYLFQFAPLHDVGKVAIPDDVLLKPGRLDDDEFEQMKLHVNKGYEIIQVMQKQFGLNALNHSQMLTDIVLYHHEAYDGSGYPEGLKGKQIPIEARIVCVADVFDALTSCRPYKDSWPNKAAYDFLLENSGKFFDPECVDHLLSHKDEIEAIQKEFGEDLIG